MTEHASWEFDRCHPVSQAGAAARACRSQTLEDPATWLIAAMGICIRCVCCLQRSSAAQPSLLQKLPGGVSVAAPKQNIAAGQAAVFAGLGGWALIQVRQLQQK
jgi:hypothetical protein